MKSSALELSANGADGGAVVASAPSVDEMISSSVSHSDSSSSETTALDELHITISGAGIDDPAPPGQKADIPKKRGRPAKGAALAAPAAPKKKKDELAADLERVTAELAAERARNDDSKIRELASSIELACYLGFGSLSESRGPHWAMGEQEAHDIGAAGAVALAPYAQQVSAQLPWAVFAGVVGKAIYSRVQIDRKLRAEAPKVAAPAA
jgi:hypothetical protein